MAIKIIKKYTIGAYLRIFQFVQQFWTYKCILLLIKTWYDDVLLKNGSRIFFNFYF